VTAYKSATISGLLFEVVRPWCTVDAEKKIKRVTSLRGGERDRSDRSDHASE